ncbi:hypothetical protein NFI96_005304 [Prochilodus magdalenae]|nr:hypothetical protein NFI96_005304 [Prochilodus magdalenae]
MLLSGDKVAFRSAGANLKQSVRAAKRAYGQKSHFTDAKDSRRLRQGFQSITDYRPRSPPSNDKTDFLNILNNYFSRFEERNTTPIMKATLSPDDKLLCFDPADIRRALPPIPIMMKCFERLVKDHITSRIPATFDLLQFAYRPNRSTDDAISAALHLSLTHLENKNRFADDTTVVGLNSNDDDSAYREEVNQLVAWCASSNLSLNVDKTKERKHAVHTRLTIHGNIVKSVKSTRFLGVHIADDLTWTTNTTCLSKGHSSAITSCEG